jgi:ribosomal protein S18 acetylase RimI-like enzyme
MQVRLATAEDAEPIARVHVRSWQVAYRGLIPDETLVSLGVVERAARWRSIFEQPGQDIFVAVENGLVQGFCDLQSSRDEEHDKQTVGEISAIYVDPAHWRKGLGRALCMAAVARARRRGFHDLVLWVLAENHGARRFYEELGFERDGDVALTRGFGAGVELTEIRYLKRLGSRAVWPHV